jgi:hypothetical protein
MGIAVPLLYSRLAEKRYILGEALPKVYGHASDGNRTEIGEKGALNNAPYL